MNTLLETLKIQNGKVVNIALHNARMHRSRYVLFGIDVWQDLSLLPEIVKIPVTDKVIKARIIYTETIKMVEWEFYKRRVVRSLKLVEDNEIEYKYKFTDRTHLNNLLSKKGECNDIIIVKNGFLTDSSYSNLAFNNGTKWITPSTPLLAGTRRAQLIESGELTENELKVSDLKHFMSCSLINALNDIGEIDVHDYRF